MSFIQQNVSQNGVGLEDVLYLSRIHRICCHRMTGIGIYLCKDAPGRGGMRRLGVNGDDSMAWRSQLLNAVAYVAIGQCQLLQYQ